MSVRVTWLPSVEPTVISFDVSRANSVGGPYVLLATVLANPAGPNFDVINGVYFYVDAAGTTNNFYTLIANDSSGSSSPPSPPFQPQSDTPTIPATTKVDHDYPTPGNLRYQTQASIPIAQALVRVFRETDFNSGNTQQPLAITQTDAAGNWTSPVYLVAGYNYVVQFAKEGWYGPDRVTITV